MMGAYDNLRDDTWAGDPKAPWNKPDEPEAEIIDPEADAEAIKKLVVAQALFKTVKGMVETKKEHNLRGEVDAIMEHRFNEAKKLGVAPKSFDLEIGGEKVGTYSITTTVAKQAEPGVEIRCKDEMELFAWAIKHGCATVDMNKVSRYFDATGEIPGGCVAVPVMRPAVEGGRIARTTLRIDPEKVADALDGELAEVTRTLLAEGE